MSLAIAIGVVITLGVVAFGVHLVLTWFERRGWVYYRTTDRPRPRSLGFLEGIYQPSSSHVIEEQITEETIADLTESGEPEA